MIDFIIQHSTVLGVGAFWVLSAAVSAMPEPMPNGSPGYAWLYKFAHTIAGNLTTAFAGKVEIK